MIVAGVRFSNFKNCQTRIQKFWFRSGVGVLNMTPATSATHMTMSVLPIGKYWYVFKVLGT